MNDMKKLMESLNKISEDDDTDFAAYVHDEEGGPVKGEANDEYTTFASGFDAGYEVANEEVQHNWGKSLDGPNEDQIEQKFTEFGGDLTEATEQINEVSDYDGAELDDVIERWEQLLAHFNIDSEDMKKQWDLMRIIFNRANQGISDLPINDSVEPEEDGLDDELDGDKYDIDPEYDDWTDHMKQMARRGR